MNRTRLSWTLFVFMALMPACGGHDHTHDDPGPGDQRPTVAVTHWTERTELFMEYPAFVAGQSGRSAIHVTDLEDFSPLSEGEAIVGLRSADGRVHEFRGGPSRPGIFGVDLEVSRPGVYEMTLRVDAPGLRDLHELGPITVRAQGAPLGAEEEEDDVSISFLKEQQWTLDFGTAPVAVRSLRSSITVPAVVQPRPGGDAVLSAPVPGQIDMASTVPVPGSRIRAGAVVVRIVPRSDDLRDAAGLRAAVIEAEQDHVLATAELERAARLVAARALPSRRLAEAEAAVTASEARLEAARVRWSRFEALSHAGAGNAGDGAFEVHAPFDGVVSDVRFAPGASVEENQLLLRLVDSRRVHIVGAVPESRVAALSSVAAAELIRDEDPPVALGEPIAVGQVIEPVARTTEVRFAFDNVPSRLQIGQSVRLRLLLGDEDSGPAIPESAVVDDGGRPVVFVQSGGESFERRAVRLGSREANYVRVLEGVEPGERVVYRGAYLIRLAAMSTQIPAHGHVH